MRYCRTKVFIAIVSLCTMVGIAQSSAQRIFPEGSRIDSTWVYLPGLRPSDFIVVHQGYVSSYNTERLIPDWVAYELTGEELLAVTERAGSFVRDPQFGLRQASSNDYSRSGYDRGHMAPAADMKWSESAMRESFYMTNMCPQSPRLNRHHWADLEKRVRNAAVRYGRVWIVSGPMPRSTGQRIGVSGVDVPEAFFKAVMSERDGVCFSAAFVMRNDDSEQKPERCVLTVDSLETLLGLDLFAGVDETRQCEAESRCDVRQWIPAD